MKISPKNESIMLSKIKYIDVNNSGTFIRKRHQPYTYFGGELTNVEIVYLCKTYRLSGDGPKLLWYYEKAVTEGNVFSHWFYFSTNDKALIKKFKDRGITALKWE
jgi:hypothetical protein